MWIYWQQEKQRQINFSWKWNYFSSKIRCKERILKDGKIHCILTADLKWHAPEMEKIGNTFSAVLHYKWEDARSHECACEELIFKYHYSERGKQNFYSFLVWFITKKNEDLIIFLWTQINADVTMKYTSKLVFCDRTESHKKL